MAEGFIRQDQLRQFKPGFNPEGDPQNWGVKDNYLRHPDIFLERLHPSPAGLGPIAIAVVGVDESAMRKTIDFDQKLRGVRRLEWREGTERNAWELDNFSSVTGLGLLPHHLTFQKGDTEVISADLQHAIALKGKGLGEFQSAFKEASHESNLSSETETTLNLLLSYR